MSAEIRVLENPELLSLAAASEIAGEIRRVLEDKPRVRIVLTGGTLGIQILKDLRALEIPVSKLDVFFGDERFVPLADSDRNEYQALEAWPELRTARLFRFPDTNGTLELARVEFDSLISSELGPLYKDAAVFDILILGMGPDGHIASLFPDHRHPDAWIVAESDSPKPPAQRLSFSYQALNRSEKVWFLVSGKTKSAATRAVLNDPACELPAARISGMSATNWFLDLEASRAL
ncbi:6-phosphogluconolactonase [Candidatus Aquiluna sp. UB-MaderosW2red]|uniref:6-phosphogluconolactonase n=1 Tax=Candidatus Aquiluna sp. UB-MaderosW2red TaxID=1855377 RepID=UPI000875E7A1|nr:6-phosphogluconolactonase [Candidatus Aquiluna sp. UB-MaderosW2red]SCX12022.1 6-phosphogluconolactonase [Candidatus Aquiluna sp. UB-MaderosW2red]